MFKKYKYDGSEKFELSKVSRNETSTCKDRAEAEAKMAENLAKIDALQKKLYADKKEGVIFLFQAMDAAGKDGTIQSVLTCLSPHGCHEVAFKSPTSDELAHDFLWRIEKQVPAKGEIAIFNRSQYEDVLIGKVKSLYLSQAHAERIDTDKVIENRYQDIINFEKYLYHNSVRTVKIFLNVSKEEQARRFLARLQEPEKNWKFSGGDYEERKYWDAYMEAFEDCINNTATKECPWYVVPADHKWYMRYVVSEILLSVMEDMNPRYPEVTPERLAQFDTYRDALIAEIGEPEAKQAEEKAAKKRSKKEKEEAKKAKKAAAAEAEKAAKAAEKEAKAAEKAEKEAKASEKAAKAVKEAEKKAEKKEAKLKEKAEKETAKVIKEAKAAEEKAEKKYEKLSEKAAIGETEKAAKAAEKEAKAAEKAEKEAKKSEKAAREAEKESKNPEKKEEKRSGKSAGKAEKQ